MAAINFVAWAPGVWADDVWALGVWEGEVVSDVAPTIGGGGSKAGGDKYRDPLIEKVLEKWAYIEEAQRRDAPIVEPVAIPEPVEALAPVPVEPEPVGPNPTIGMPFQLPGFNAAPVPPLTVPLGPDLAERARKARERDDEQALLLILSQVL